MSKWPNVKLIWCSSDTSTGGYIWLSNAFSIAFLKMSSWPDVVLLLTTRCLYWGVHLSDILGTSENLNTLCISCFASQRSFLWKTNEIKISNSSSSSNDKIGHNISRYVHDWDKDILNLFRTVQSNLNNITPTGHFAKFCGHTTGNTAAPCPVPTQDKLKYQMDDIGPEDSLSQVSKTSTLLNNILQHLMMISSKKRAEFEKNIQKQRQKLLAQFQLLLGGSAI